MLCPTERTAPPSVSCPTSLCSNVSHPLFQLFPKHPPPRCFALNLLLVVAQYMQHYGCNMPSHKPTTDSQSHEPSPMCVSVCEHVCVCMRSAWLLLCKWSGERFGITAISLVSLASNHPLRFLSSRGWEDGINRGEREIWWEQMEGEVRRGWMVEGNRKRWSRGAGWWWKM